MTHIIYCIGIQASGKSTWAKDFCFKNRDYKRLNMDSIRQLLGVKWDLTYEADVRRIHYHLIEFYIEQGWNIVIDNTGFAYSQFYDMLSHLDKDNDIKVELKYFPITLQEAIERDAKRGEYSVGPIVVKEFYNKFVPTVEARMEQFKDELKRVGMLYEN